MDENQWLADLFEEQRPRLRAVAYRMLGSLAEADDAVQETWLRLSRAGTDEVENLRGWVTTITARVCLNMLRSRNFRREESLTAHVPDPVISMDGELQPEEEALLADSVGLALQVVLGTLTPAERLAFVLHDMFGLPFGEIAPLAGRTPAAARQLASRARRRVKGADTPAPDPDLGRQRSVVEAFFAAAREGDFDALVAVLDPDAVLRVDAGAARPAGSVALRGADAVARQALTGLTSSLRAVQLRPALVNGAAGVIVTMRGRPVTVMGFTIHHGKIAEINAIADPERLAAITAAVPAGERSSFVVTAPDRTAALSEQLIHVHQELREWLASLRQEAAGGAGRHAAGTAIGEDLLSHCLSFCTVIHTHHTGEDSQLLPALRAAVPELAPVIDNLAEDHALVAGILGQVRELLTPGRDPSGRDALVRELDGLIAILESHFSYEERRIARALDILGPRAWTADVFAPARTQPGKPHRLPGRSTASNADRVPRTPHTPTNLRIQPISHRKVPESRAGGQAGADVGCRSTSYRNLCAVTNILRRIPFGFVRVSTRFRVSGVMNDLSYQRTFRSSGCVILGLAQTPDRTIAGKRAAERHQAETPGPVIDLLLSGRSLRCVKWLSRLLSCRGRF